VIHVQVDGLSGLRDGLIEEVLGHLLKSIDLSQRGALTGPTQSLLELIDAIDQVVELGLADLLSKSRGAAAQQQ
jgi:hypothetical protein